jgi:hypothetical protein
VPAGAPTPEEVVAAPAAAAPAAAATPAEPIDVQQALKALRENRRNLAIYSGDAGNFLKYMQNSYQGMSVLSAGDERAKVFANAIKLDVYDNLLNLPPAYATNIASALGYKSEGAMFNGALDSEDIIAKVDRAINDPETVGLGDLSTVYYDLTKDLSFLSDPDDVLAAKQRLGQIKAAIDAIPPEIRGNIGREIDAAYQQFAESGEDDITKINQLFGRLIGAGEDALEVSPTSDAAEMMRKRVRPVDDEVLREERGAEAVSGLQSRLQGLQTNLSAAEADAAPTVKDANVFANDAVRRLKELQQQFELGVAGGGQRRSPANLEKQKRIESDFDNAVAMRRAAEEPIKRIRSQIGEVEDLLGRAKEYSRGEVILAESAPQPPLRPAAKPLSVEPPKPKSKPKPKYAAARPPAAAPAPTPAPGVVPNLPAMISTLEDFINDPPPGMADTDVKQAKNDLVDLRQQLYEAG